jgi:hypothetical protein
MFCTTKDCDSVVMALLFASSSILNYLLCHVHETKGALSVTAYINALLNGSYMLARTTLVSCAVLRACCAKSPEEKVDALEALRILFEFGGHFDGVRCDCDISPRVWLLLMLWGTLCTYDVLSAAAVLDNDFSCTLQDYDWLEAADEDSFSQLLGLAAAGSSSGSSLSTWTRFHSVKSILTEEDLNSHQSIIRAKTTAWLHGRIGRPRSLQHLCRLEFRRHLMRGGARGPAQLSTRCAQLNLTPPATALVLCQDASDALDQHNPDLHLW